MKSFYAIVCLAISCIAIFACDPTSPAPSINYKIKQLTVLFNADTVNYTFNYSANSLTSVTRDGHSYAELITNSSNTNVIMNHNFYPDTFLVAFNAENYIDSVRHLNGSDYRKYYRNSANYIDSCRYTESNHPLFFNHFIYSGNQPVNYRHSNNYTCGFYSNCLQENTDTVLYSTYTNQTNLPEQFTTLPISEGLSMVDLNPVFLVQQNGIFPYKPHVNLISGLFTHYSIFISQYPPKPYHFRYSYAFDAKGRVSLIYQYDDLTSVSIPFKTYAITYFD